MTPRKQIALYHTAIFPSRRLSHDTGLLSLLDCSLKSQKTKRTSFRLFLSYLCGKRPVLWKDLLFTKVFAHLTIDHGYPFRLLRDDELKKILDLQKEAIFLGKPTDNIIDVLTQELSNNIDV